MILATIVLDGKSGACRHTSKLDSENRSPILMGVKVSYLTSVAKQAKTASLHAWADGMKVTDRRDRTHNLSLESAALTTCTTWLGTVVTSHTASDRQAYTPVMSMLQKLYKVLTAPRAFNQQTHKCQMLDAVKCSLYVVGQLQKKKLVYRGENVTKLLGVSKRTWWQNNIMIFFSLIPFYSS